MLRGFFVIFILCAIATVAVLGFRGQKSPQPPTEVFPDMVRQPKVRAQAPLDFFADGRGPRLPVAGTVPMGYEMPPAPNASHNDAGGRQAKGDTPPTGFADAPEEAHTRIAFSAGTDYFNTGKMGDQWGTGLPLPVTRELMERGQQRLPARCATAPPLLATESRSSTDLLPSFRFRTIASAKCLTAKFSTRLPTEKTR